MTQHHTRASATSVPFCSNGNDNWITWGVGNGLSNEVMVIATGHQTGFRLGIAEHRWPAGSVGVDHSHLLEDEGFYVLEGEVTFTMPDDDVEFTAGQGEFVWHPHRRRHGYRVAPEGAARVLQVQLPGTSHIPGLFRRLARDTSAPAEAAVDWMRDEFGLVHDVPGGRRLPRRPASTRGAGLADGRPSGDHGPANRPFKSDRSVALDIFIGRGMMTNVHTVFHAFGRQTGNVFGLAEMTWGPGDVAGPHVHTLEDEGFYILDGEFTLHVSGPNGVVNVVARPGDFVWAPRDMPHYYEVENPSGARVLVMAVPGTTLIDLFYGITAQEGRASDIESDEGLEVFAAWAAEEHGLHFLAEGEFPEV